LARLENLVTAIRAGIITRFGHFAGLLTEHFR
jgi:hypothetical protein